MEKFETQQQVLRNEQQYYGIARITGSRNITGFVCALGQYLRSYIAPNIKFGYKWAKLPDGTLYFAIVGSRAVQDVFERYLTTNHGDYFDSTVYISYERNDKAFNRVFDGYFIQRQLPNGFASGGSHP